jgi:hypothetical protein
MASPKKTKKHPAPARVRPRVGAKNSRPKLLAVGQQYISGQASGDTQNKLTAQAQTVSTTRTSLVTLLGKRSDLKAQLATTEGAIVVADAQYGSAVTAYADAAALLAAGDASILAGLGVAAAASPIKPVDEIVAAPVLKVVQGVSSGDVKLECARVPHAGAYIFEYKLEPSQPTDPWLGNIVTKFVSTVVPGLAAAQAIRVRARAVGVTPGPWSVEVVGRAK